MSEVIAVDYTVEFNKPNTFDKFISYIAQNDLFNEIELTTNQQTVAFTLPREIIRSFEKMRKRFQIRNCVYSDKITTTSIYK